MTITQAHRSFRFGMDKMDSLNYPNFQPEEIDLLLNQAQERFIKQRYGDNNIKRTGFEQTEKRTEDIKEVIFTVQMIPTVPAFVDNSVYNAVNFDISEINHWFTVWDKVIMTCTACNGTVNRPVATYGLGPSNQVINGVEAEVRAISHLEYEKSRKDEFKKPDHTKVFKLMFGGIIEIVPPTDCTVLYYIMRYIRKPVQVSLAGNITFELSEHTHQEIVDLAIQIALEGIEARRTQTFTPIINNNNE